MALELFIQGSFMILAFLLGKGVNFSKKTKEKELSKEEIEKKNKEYEILSTTLANIDAYDGTGYGQKDIPYE